MATTERLDSDSSTEMMLMVAALCEYKRYRLREYPDLRQTATIIEYSSEKPATS